MAEDEHRLRLGLGALEGADVVAAPGDQHELGALGLLVAGHNTQVRVLRLAVVEHLGSFLALT